jgi:hypothetical protein
MGDAMPTPRFSPWFWPLIESLDNNEVKMRKAFRAMSKRQLIAFFRQFRIARGEVNPQSRSDMPLREVSEDALKDFAAWVVSQGREFYDEVRTNPAAVEDYWDQFTAFERKYRHFREPDGIAGQVFYERFEEEIVLLAFPR